MVVGGWSVQMKLWVSCGLNQARAVHSVAWGRHGANKPLFWGLRSSMQGLRVACHSSVVLCAHVGVLLYGQAAGRFLVPAATEWKADHQSGGTGCVGMFGKCLHLIRTAAFLLCTCVQLHMHSPDGRAIGS